GQSEVDEEPQQRGRQGAWSRGAYVDYLSSFFAPAAVDQHRGDSAAAVSAASDNSDPPFWRPSRALTAIFQAQGPAVLTDLRHRSSRAHRLRTGVKHSRTPCGK